MRDAPLAGMPGIDMRILGVDWGERRIGLAVSDETQTIATPHSVARCSSDADRVACIEKQVREQAASMVVLGMPLSLSGEDGPMGRAVRRFSEVLAAKLDVPVVLWDERLTTGRAERALIEGGVRRERRKELVDKVAAAVMLQSYLDCRDGVRDSGNG